MHHCLRLAFKWITIMIYRGILIWNGTNLHYPSSFWAFVSVFFWLAVDKRLRFHLKAYLLSQRKPKEQNKMKKENRLKENAIKSWQREMSSYPNTRSPHTVMSPAVVSNRTSNMLPWIWKSRIFHKVTMLSFTFLPLKRMIPNIIWIQFLLPVLKKQLPVILRGNIRKNSFFRTLFRHYW